MDVGDALQVFHPGLLKTKLTNENHQTQHNAQQKTTPTTQTKRKSIWFQSNHYFINLLFGECYVLIYLYRLLM